MPSFLVRQLPSIYRTEKKIPTYRRYVRNSNQSDFDLFADHTNAKIVIIPIISLNLLKRQNNTVVQLDRYNLKQPACCEDVIFGHVPLLNCEDLARLINKVV